MRDSTETKLLTCEIHRLRKGQPYRVYPGSSNVQISSVSRSDVQRTKSDSTGWRSPTPYQAYFDEVSPWEGSGEWLTTQNEYYRYHRVGSADPYTTVTYFRLPALPTGAKPCPSWLEQRAVNRALSDLKDSTVNYAVALAEANKAASLVSATARQLVRALRSARKGNLYAAARALGVARPRKHKRRRPVYGHGRHAEKEMSSRWLELNYGWMPLIMDIHGVFQDFEKGILREPRIAVTKQSRHTERHSENMARPSQSLYTSSFTATNEHVARVRLDYVLDSRAFQQLAQKGVTNPLLVAWELVPYSFVVDWFVPVQEFLSTLDAAGGLTFKGGSVTRYTRTELKATASMHTTNSGWACGGSASGSRRSAVMHRSVLSAPPSGGLYIKNPFSASHALSALALLSRRFRP